MNEADVYMIISVWFDISEEEAKRLFRQSVAAESGDWLREEGD